jgi:regulatory protein YycH of two-component signal transduction system YycFG
MLVREINRKKFCAASESERAKSKAMMEKMRKDGEKMVKGMFEFVEAQGGWLDFSYRFFPGEPIRSVKINHGEIVDVPMILAKHLNNVYKKVRKLADNADANSPTVTKMSRCRFIPFEMLTEDLIAG